MAKVKGRNTKTVQRANAYRKTYNLTVDKYNAMADEQEYVCKICHKECSSGKYLGVDHDHKTGKIRGLLCGKCNTGLGMFNDDPRLLSSAISYLQSSSIG